MNVSSIQEITVKPNLLRKAGGISGVRVIESSSASFSIKW
jgi:hypothetical protein